MVDNDHPQTKIILQASFYLDTISGHSRHTGSAEPGEEGDNEIVLSAIRSLQSMSVTHYPKQCTAIINQLRIIERSLLTNENSEEEKQDVQQSLSCLDKILGTWAI